MGQNAGRLDVLARQGGQSTALVRSDGLPGSILDMEQALAAAEQLSRSGLVPRSLAGKPAAIVRVGMKAQAMGINFFEGVDVIDAIDGRPVPSAQCRLGHIRRRGHEARYLSAAGDREKAVIRARRREYRNDPEAWEVVEYTIEDAEFAGLLDEWVERKYRNQGDQYDRTEKLVLSRTDTGYQPAAHGAEMPEWATEEVKAGHVKRRDNWWKARPAMLRARAASTLYAMHFSDLMFAAGLDPLTAEEMGGGAWADADIDDPDDDVVDGEIIEQGEDPGVTPAPAPPSGPVEAATIEPEGGRDNEGAQVVGGSAAPAPPGPGPIDLKARAKAAGVTQADLLRKAQEFSAARDLPAPATLSEIDEQVEADCIDWMGE